MSRFFSAFLILYAVIEFAAFYGLGRLMGFGWAMLLIAGLFVVGLAIAMFETRRIATMARNDATNPLVQLEHETIQEAASRQTSNATKLLADTALIFIGSFLLVIPGVVSTIVGFIMILPPVRALIRVSASAALTKKLQRLSTHGINVMTQDASLLSYRVPPAPDNEWADDVANDPNVWEDTSFSSQDDADKHGTGKNGNSKDDKDNSGK